MHARAAQGHGQGRALARPRGGEHERRPEREQQEGGAGDSSTHAAGMAMARGKCGLARAAVDVRAGEAQVRGARLGIHVQTGA